LTQVPGRDRSPRGRPSPAFRHDREQGLCGEVHPDGRGNRYSGSHARPTERRNRRFARDHTSVVARTPTVLAADGKHASTVLRPTAMAHRQVRRPTIRSACHGASSPTNRLAPAQAKSPPASSSSSSSVTDRNHLAVRVRCREAGRLNSAAAGAWWVSTRKGLVWVVADPAGRTSASEPKATEARLRRGAELEAMIETRGA
jgi:hypothetical protein